MLAITIALFRGKILFAYQTVGDYMGMYGISILNVILGLILTYTSYIDLFSTGVIIGALLLPRL